MQGDLPFCDAQLGENPAPIVVLDGNGACESEYADDSSS